MTPKEAIEEAMSEKWTLGRWLVTILVIVVGSALVAILESLAR